MRTEQEIRSSWKNTDNITVSITCIAYNHEPFIEQCIQGFLIQQTDFAFEIMIHDDASTDNTQEIILKYQKLYPNLIRTILQTENHWLGKGINATTTIVWPGAKGKYIAWCEGDDYWTDPLKLQKQVDFLQVNEEYVIHSGAAQILEDQNVLQNMGQYEDCTFTMKDFLTGNNLITCTVMFRKPEVFPVFPNVTYADWLLYCSLLSQKTSFKAFRSGQLFAVYRVHSGGIMATINSGRKNYETDIAQIMTIYKTFKVQYKKEDFKKINLWHLELMNIYLQNKEIGRAFKLLLSNFVLCGSKTNIKGYLSILKRQFIK